MKNLLVTILAFVYLSTSTGATIHLHYCMGKLISWALIDHKKDNCDKCGMVKNSSGSAFVYTGTECCRDEHKQIKTSNDQKLIPAEFFSYNNLSHVIALDDQPGLQNIRTFTVSIAHPNTHAPPLIGKLPLFIIQRNFRL